MSRERKAPCPRCGRMICAHETECPHCGADLKALALMDEAPDACFNQALQAIREHQWADAISQLAVALHYRPDDGEAWVLLGKIYARLECTEEAATCFSRGQMCPSDSAAADCLRACGVEPFDPSNLTGA